jgi:hypothetical protein
MIGIRPVDTKLEEASSESVNTLAGRLVGLTFVGNQVIAEVIIKGTTLRVKACPTRKNYKGMFPFTFPKRESSSSRSEVQSKRAYCSTTRLKTIESKKITLTKTIIDPLGSWRSWKCEAAESFVVVRGQRQIPRLRVPRS